MSKVFDDFLTESKEKDELRHHLPNLRHHLPF